MAVRESAMKVATRTRQGDEAIYQKRKSFRWLPIRFSSDLEHGSMWYYWGSLLSILTPIFPLISLYERLWTNTDIVPLSCHVAGYCLLCYMGISYTVGSWLFARATRSPQPPPLFTWRHFNPDELLGMWCFYVGTLPAVPVSAMYTYYTSLKSEFGLALALSMFSCIAVQLGVLATYPSEEDRANPKPLEPTSHVSKYITHCCGDNFCCRIKVHLENDWLIASWLFAIASLFGSVMSAGLLLDNIVKRDGLQIYNYALGFCDCVMFTIGSIYFIAGSYNDEGHDQVQDEAAPDDGAGEGASTSPQKYNPKDYAVEVPGEEFADLSVMAVNDDGPGV